MQLLIKDATIINPLLRGQIIEKKDLLISNGRIEKIAEKIDVAADLIIERPNLHVSIGWMDVFAQFNEPGFEYRETLESGSLAAAAGGFTDVVLLPNLMPVTQTKTQVEYLRNKSEQHPVNFHPIGAVTKDLEGKSITEMYDMAAAGAIAFGDGKTAIQDSGIMLKALQYVLANNKTIIQLPEDHKLQPEGLMQEGIISTQLGLPGKSELAEELMVARDIELLRYTGSRLHLTGISTEKSISLVQQAKKDGLSITCSTTPYHLFFCDQDLVGYDSHLKVSPPLRNKQQKENLAQALIEGKIDCVASHHQPLHSDEKDCEFQKAIPGMETLEIVFSVLQQLLQDTHACVRLMGIQPRKIFDLPLPEITVGATACMTLFDPDQVFTFKESMIKSRSKNNAFIGRSLKGKVYGIINGNKFYLND